MTLQQPSIEPVYVADNIKSKRFRRTKAEVAGIRNAILDILSEDNPQTVRQVFYALTVRGAIAKAEIEYQRTVIRLLVEMREAGTIPFTWIADNTRWMRKPATFTGLESCLQNASRFYRRDLWAAMPVYVEVWCEKDALAGVLMEETEVFDVPLNCVSVLVWLASGVDERMDRGGHSAGHRPVAGRAFLVGWRLGPLGWSPCGR